MEQILEYANNIVLTVNVTYILGEFEWKDICSYSEPVLKNRQML